MYIAAPVSKRITMGTHLEDLHFSHFSELLEVLATLTLFPSLSGSGHYAPVFSVSVWELRPKEPDSGLTSCVISCFVEVGQEFSCCVQHRSTTTTRPDLCLAVLRIREPASAGSLGPSVCSFVARGPDFVRALRCGERSPSRSVPFIVPSVQSFHVNLEVPVEMSTGDPSPGSS